MKKGFRIIKFKKDKPIFEVKNVSKSFDGRPILKQISITIYPGEIVGLLGPNGSGKSTQSQLLYDKQWNALKLLNNKDIDYALNKIGVSVTDWSGGTKIASSI